MAIAARKPTYTEVRDGLVKIGLEPYIAEDIAKHTESGEITKQDLELSEVRIRSDIKVIESSLHAEIKDVENALRSEIKDVENNLNAKIDKVENALRTDIADVRHELKSMAKFNNWTMSFVIVLLAAMLGAMLFK